MTFIEYLIAFIQLQLLDFLARMCIFIGLVVVVGVASITYYSLKAWYEDEEK